jgi:hypothetical protein
MNFAVESGLGIGHGLKRIDPPHDQNSWQQQSVSELEGWLSPTAAEAALMLWDSLD